MTDKAINYEVFAEFYDPVMGERSDSIERVKNLIEEYKPDAKTVLELAAGTGSVLKGLADEYEVFGLDLSPKMLEIARQKVPEAQLFEEDMSDFELERTFDVIICVFDSINNYGLPPVVCWIFASAGITPTDPLNRLISTALRP
jgi:ubiquinone/menaquinone biosynthesis C-methylase UbiE